MEQVATILTRPTIAEMILAGSKNLRLSSAPKADCWRCQGAHFESKLDAEGISRARLCRCQRIRILRSSLRIPPAFGKPVLGRLKPRGHKHQAKVIAMIQQEPGASYLFTGRNGSGKTHFCWALCRAALIRGNRVRGLLLSELISQYRDWEIDDKAPMPCVLPEHLKSSTKYTLFLDEFEKVNTTEFASRKLFELMNAARDFEHQVLIASNKDWSRVRDIWSKSDPVYGDSIMKRVENCRLVEMF